METASRVGARSHATDAAIIHNPTRAGYLEFSIINNYFSDYHDQHGKLRLYGEIAADASTRWMTVSIQAESRVVRVV